MLVSLSAIALHAAQQATVDVDELPVHSSSSYKSGVIGSLKRGDSVTLGLILSGGDQSWCEVTFPGPSALSGFVPCGQLHRESLPAEPNYTVATPSSSVGARVSPDAAIAEALRLSGIGQAIRQLGDPALYLQAIPQKQLTPEQAAEVRQIVMQSMRQEKFEQAVTSSLKNGYPAEAYPQLLEILRSPLARRMTSIELEETRADPKELQAFVAGLKHKPPDPQHLAIVNRIDQVTRNSQLMVEIVAAVLEGVASGSGLSASQSRKMIDELRGERSDTLRQAALLHLLYQYRAVPDDQLNEYTTMLSAPQVVRFNQVAQSGLVEATRQSSGEMMSVMIRRFHIKMPPPQ